MHEGMVESWNRFLRDLLPFIIQLPADFHDNRGNDWRRQGNESTTLWQRPGRHTHPHLDNPEIRMRIQDRFRLRLDALAEVCALWEQSS